jgi:hypothetical protein
MQAQNSAQGFAKISPPFVSTLKRTFFHRPERLGKDTESILIETLADYIDGTAIIKANTRLSKETAFLKIVKTRIAHDLKDYKEKFWEHKILKQLIARKQAHLDEKPGRQRAALKIKKDYKALVAKQKKDHRAAKEAAKEKGEHDIVGSLSLSFLDLEAVEV